MSAVDTAVRLGAVAVSNSYGGLEDRSILAADKHLRHPGVAIVASSGDDGYGANWPASSPYVTAVGGTTLRVASGRRGFAETVWAGAGSGCSRYEKKPSWQHDAACKRRTVADAAAVANPRTGLGIYDTFNDCISDDECDYALNIGAAEGLNGWAQVGGTSLAAPIVASVYALAGRKVNAAARIYKRPKSLFDVTAGGNGSCHRSYLCTAKKGYDGPTGLGTPRGGGAF